MLWTTFYYPQKVLHILSLGFITFPKVMHIVHRVIHKNKDFYPHSPFLQNLTHKNKSQHFVLLYLLLKFFILIHSKQKSAINIVTTTFTDNLSNKQTLVPIDLSSRNCIKL